MDDLFQYPVRVLGLVAVVLLMLGVRIHRGVVLGIAALGFIAFFVSFAAKPPSGADFRDFFHKAGVSMHEGRSPYETTGVMNPPPAFPLYWLFGTLPMETARAIWVGFLMLGSLTLVELSRRILKASGDPAAEGIDLPELLLLTSVLCQSRANRMGIELGQLALPVALWVLGAILAHQRGRKVFAGGLMALASIKTPTMIPCLLLFHRRSDWKAWASMSVVGVALACSFVSPVDLPSVCRTCLDNIAETRQAGGTDDYELSNHRTSSLIAFNLLVNRLGIEDRASVGAIQGAALLLLLVGVLCLLKGRKPLEAGAACSVVVLTSMLFMYHRQYDLIVLALPLAYAFGRARWERGRIRLLYALCACCLLAAMSSMPWLMESVRRRVLERDDLASILLRVFVLPHLTWLVLTGLVLFVVAEKARTRRTKEIDHDEPARSLHPRMRRELQGATIG